MSEYLFLFLSITVLELVLVERKVVVVSSAGDHGVVGYMKNHFGAGKDGFHYPSPHQVLLVVGSSDGKMHIGERVIRLGDKRVRKYPN